MVAPHTLSEPQTWKQGVLVLVTGAVISVGSVAHILYTASEEPFFFMRLQTLLVLEGLGAILLVSLVIWAKAAVAAARRIQPSKLRVSLVAVAVGWTFLCVYYLTGSMGGCLEDYQRFRGGEPGTLGSVKASTSEAP